jgi:hypothetical protein
MANPINGSKLIILAADLIGGIYHYKVKVIISVEIVI